MKPNKDKEKLVSLSTHHTMKAYWEAQTVSLEISISYSRVISSAVVFKRSDLSKLYSERTDKISFLFRCP
jgi:hypothetical protein